MSYTSLGERFGTHAWYQLRKKGNMACVNTTGPRPGDANFVVLDKAQVRQLAQAMDLLPEDKGKITIVCRGGNADEVEGLPKGWTWKVIDWHNLESGHCPDCDKYVDGATEACPHCGFRLDQ